MVFEGVGVNKSEFFMITKYEPNHTCSLDYHNVEHRQASSQIIDECVIPRLISFGATMIPMDIVNFMQVEYRVGINYQKAWRAQTYAIERIRDSPSDSYALLPL